MLSVPVAVQPTHPFQTPMHSSISKEESTLTWLLTHWKEENTITSTKCASVWIERGPHRLRNLSCTWTKNPHMNSAWVPVQDEMLLIRPPYCCSGCRQPDTTAVGGLVHTYCRRTGVALALTFLCYLWGETTIWHLPRPLSPQPYMWWMLHRHQVRLSIEVSDTSGSFPSLPVFLKQVWIVSVICSHGGGSLESPLPTSWLMWGKRS